MSCRHSTSYRVAVCLVFCLLVLASAGIQPAAGQVLEDFNRTNLRDLIPGFLSGGFAMADTGGPVGSGEFVDDDSPQLAALRRLNQALAVQLSTFPLSSSAGGFVYEFDPGLGTFTRLSDSFGPIFAERSQTLGKGRFNVGMSFSSFSFDQMDGLNLRDGDLWMAFPHVDANEDGSRLTPWYEGDIISAQLFLKMQTNITAFVLSYGVSDRFDIGVAVPLVDVDLEATAVAEIQTLATEDADIHRFINDDDVAVVSEQGDATGVGDVLLRAKYQLVQRGQRGLALLADLRLPTGEERDLLGTGQWQLHGQLLGSTRWGELHPHFNFGVALRGGDLTNEISQVVGVEWSPHPRVTFSADHLGRYLLDVEVIESRSAQFDANTNSGVGPPVVESEIYPLFGVNPSESLYKQQASIGLKLNVTGNLLLTANALVALSENGLNDGFTPLVGVDYAF